MLEKIRLICNKLKVITLFLFIILAGALMLDCTGKRQVTLQDEAKNKFSIRINDQAGYEEIIIAANDFSKLILDLTIREESIIIMHFNEYASDRIYSFTVQNLGETVYIYFENTLLNSPMIQDAIRERASVSVKRENIDFLISKNAFTEKDLKKIEKWLNE